MQDIVKDSRVERSRIGGPSNGSKVSLKKEPVIIGF